MHAVRGRLTADSCGCAMASIFLGIGLSLAVAWYALDWGASGLSFAAMLLRIFLFAVVTAVIGKAVGIGLFSLRSKKKEGSPAQP